MISELMAMSRVAGASQTYVDDVFSAYTYTGNGSTQTINNGIDLAGKGGLVWLKERSNTGSSKHDLSDTARGTNSQLDTASTAVVQTEANRVTAFNSNGLSIGNSGWINNNNSTYVGWTFRKAPKFFDVVTYTGDGTNNRFINHSLGATPGMVIVKQTNAVADWYVWHTGLTTGNNLNLNLNSAQFGASVGVQVPTATQFQVGSAAVVNGAGNTYVAYLFAHDTSVTGLIQCGSFTTDGSGNATVTLGWEPQWLMVKRINGIGSWRIFDSSRGFVSTDSSSNILDANLSTTEVTGVNGQPRATGFFHGNYYVSEPIVYLAIRRPNKPPTSGAQVYNAIARTGTSAAATVTGVGFAPDLVHSSTRGSGPSPFYDRLRGNIPRLLTTSAAAEDTVDDGAAEGITAYGMDGISLGTDVSNVINSNTLAYIYHFFRRAPGFFDEVCYTGTGANKTETHSLTVAPELWIVKGRDTAGEAWQVGCTAFAATDRLILNSTAAKDTSPTIWNSTYPTSTVFNIGTAGGTNTSGKVYVAYLFATLAGISKCGSYTGNGTNQTINCGFSAGSRFVLIKRTDSTGDWYIWDTVRGIIAGNDPHLSLNTAAAEVTTDDSIDPDTSGFVVNQLAATNINVTSATYIFLAIA